MNNEKDKKNIVNGNYLSRKQIAEKLNVTTRTIDNYIRDGKLSAYKLGGKVVILEKDLNELVKKI